MFMWWLHYWFTDWPLVSANTHLWEQWKWKKEELIGMGIGLVLVSCVDPCRSIQITLHQVFNVYVMAALLIYWLALGVSQHTPLRRGWSLKSWWSGIWMDLQGSNHETKVGLQFPFFVSICFLPGPDAVPFSHLCAAFLRALLQTQLFDKGQCEEQARLTGNQAKMQGRARSAWHEPKIRILYWCICRLNSCAQ